MSSLFPFLDLHLHSERLLLRPRSWDDQSLKELYTSISGRLLLPEQQHWMRGDWHQKSPEELYREGARNTLRQMLSWSVDEWSLQFFVYSEDRAIGAISLSAVRFLQRRSISTGSWLDPDYRKKGYGREMRGAALFFGFHMLGAEEFRSAAHEDNTPSQRTSLSLGYKKGWHKN